MVWGLRRDLGRVRRKKAEEEEEEGRTVKRALVWLSVFLFMFDIFSGGDGRRRGGIISIFAEAGSGTSGGGGGGGGGFWLSSTGLQPSNVGIAIAVTAMAGLALAATVVYSRR